MAAIVYKTIRAPSIPHLQKSAKNLAVCLSSSCGDDKDEGDQNQPVHYCPCCNSLCNFCPSPNNNMYDARKYSHCLPCNKHVPNFPPLPQIPADVFRCTDGEKLGPQGQAGKFCMYRNPEYFSFHHMTYYDMHIALRNYRQPCPDSGRKPP